jgi:hypothetical protein
MHGSSFLSLPWRADSLTKALPPCRHEPYCAACDNDDPRRSNPAKASARSRPHLGPAGVGLRDSSHACTPGDLFDATRSPGDFRIKSILRRRTQKGTADEKDSHIAPGRNAGVDCCDDLSRFQRSLRTVSHATFAKRETTNGSRRRRESACLRYPKRQYPKRHHAEPGGVDLSVSDRHLFQPAHRRYVPCLGGGLLLGLPLGASWVVRFDTRAVFLPVESN